VYLLDTNVVSELRKARPHGAVLAWIKGVDDASLYLSAVTLAEIQAGIEITRDRDPAKAAEIEAWLDLLTDHYQILALDGPIFRQWAKLMHKKSDTLYEDAMIAATARVHGLRVVTRNLADFAEFGVELINPFA
jgi:hypothetical protein